MSAIEKDVAKLKSLKAMALGRMAASPFLLLTKKGKIPDYLPKKKRLLGQVT